jgi:hypothetical protein
LKLHATRFLCLKYDWNTIIWNTKVVK